MSVTIKRTFSVHDIAVQLTASERGSSCSLTAMEILFFFSLTYRCIQDASRHSLLRNDRNIVTFLKGSKENRSNFLTNNVVSQQLSSCLSLLSLEATACACEELEPCVWAGLAVKKGDANSDSPQAMKKTLVWCAVPLKDLQFYLCTLNFCFICLCGTSSAAECPPSTLTPMTFEGSWEHALL